VKLITPTPLVAEAADVLAGFRDLVVVVGATAIEVVLSDADVAITPTRDVDVVVPVEEAEAIVSALEADGLRRSDVPHERPFTWVRGDLKVQLVRTFHPFPPKVAKALPQNPVFGMASEPASQVEVAFVSEPARRRLRCANALCLLALKEAAFGRTRAGSDQTVQRDFHDAFLLIDAVMDDVVGEWQAAGREIRKRALRAITTLGEGGDATAAAARELVQLGHAVSQRQAETRVRRVAGAALRALEAR
jgi:hypothetical protein